MARSSLFFAAAVLTLLTSGDGMAQSPVPATSIRHDINVVIEPSENRITVEDSITLPAARHGELTFQLHEGMHPITPTPGVRITKSAESVGDVPVEAYRVSLPPHITTFVLRYRGEITHPLESVGSESARGFTATAGSISDEGVFLSAGSYWYARFPADFVTFTLEAAVPAGWDVVSQGARTLHGRRETGTYVRWESQEPQDEIYLIANRFTEYTKTADGTLAMVFLRSADPQLAANYLDATVKYLAMYEGLIGPYPYKKFALVENFWETGYGMPSFTLLGPAVLRLPFIINSSYPHEILHSWWGNSVFPDWAAGNWSEGLTAYLADHLIKEQQGAGAEYRQTTLQKYADYVITGRDFPLSEFRSRHSSPSEAIGYGKSLMFFHMLRRELGDRAFTDGLREFYRSSKFTYASFDDIRRSFEKTSGKSLKADFDQWVTRPGAPLLALTSAVAKSEKDGHVIYTVLEQVQPGPAYRMRVPVAVTLEGQERAYQAVVEMNTKKQPQRLKLPGRPLRIDIDPEFDLFRRLDRGEMPPAITQALGAERMLILVPSSAHKELLKGYRDLAQTISAAGPDQVEVKLDTEVSRLPDDRTVVVLGWENAYLDNAAASLARYGFTAGAGQARIDSAAHKTQDHSFVLASHHPRNRDRALVLIAADNAAALPGLGRKLPHYHKYSYLVFEGDEPVNRVKGRWPVADSPLTAYFPGSDGNTLKVSQAKLAPRAPLTALPPAFSKERMLDTVRVLASDDFKGRGIGTPELDRAADYIARRFQDAGLKPGGGGGTNYLQSFQGRAEATGGMVTMKNVVGFIPGGKKEFAGQSVVIGAHYDHLGLGWPDVRAGNKGKIHPGADDNASGVAVLIELANVLGRTAPDRTIVFAAFTGEEAGRLGSKHYVASAHRPPAERIIAMVNLDTVGRLGKGRLLVLGGASAKEWMHLFRGAGYLAGIETAMVSERLDASDQTSFEEAGIPAVQLFTGPHADYHRPQDRPDKIDGDGLAAIAALTRETVEYLAGRDQPLTPSAAPDLAAPAHRTSGRTVSFGTVPDFSFTGTGCRITGVLPGSPAEAAGLRAGDVIVKLNTNAVTGLKDYAAALAALLPGDRITVVLLRDGKTIEVESAAAAR